MISRFFIDRPIFASVLSIVITLAGGISLFTLPLAQFPSITPPTVQVTCTYPGASAREVADSVAAPIEQQVNGVENMMYMSSQCANDGSYNLTVTFNQGVDLNMAQVLVQNRVNLAVPQLPDVIKQTGVTTRKRSPDILLGLALNSPDGRYDQLYLSNYALMQVQRRAGPDRRRRRRLSLRPARLQHAHLGRPAEARVAPSVGGRRGPSDSRAELASRHRLDRSTADGRPPRSADHVEHARSPDRARAIREHRPQDARPTAGSRGSRT